MARIRPIAQDMAPTDPTPQGVAERGILEPRTAAAPAASRRAPILVTKLFVPLLTAEHVSRPRLAARLAAGLTGRLTLVSAPPGFGKTTALAEWLHAVDRPVAWLSLDDGDSDPTVFLRYLVAALQPLAVSTAEAALSVLQSPQPPPPHEVLALIINDLARQRQPWILVLDDYHALHGAPAHTLTTFLVDHLPPSAHLVIATRRDPPLPLARLRARRQLNEVRAADLRFSVDEADVFLNGVMGLDLAAENVAALETRTDGWIAGLQLAALSLRDEPDAARFVARFSGSHRYVLDYLIEEVLSRQPEAVQSFLLRTSILQRLCGPLCASVTGESGAEGMLHVLETQNLFTMPLDTERRWYRYHPLFADLLQARLHQAHPGLAPELHRRASRWYETEGLPGEAIRHAVAGQDFEQAAALLEQSAEGMWMRGEFATLEHGLAALPPSLVAARPRLLLAHAWARFLVDSASTAVEPMLSAVEALIDPPEPSAPSGGTLAHEPSAEIRGIAAAIRASRASKHEDVAAAIAQARQALELLPRDNLVWRSVALVNLGLAYEAAGQVRSAGQTLQEASEVCETAGNHYVALVATMALGRTRFAQGDLKAAARAYEQALAMAAQHGMRDLPMVRDHVRVRLGRLHYEWNDIDVAEAHLRAGMEGLKAQSAGWLLAEGCVLLAHLRWVHGDRATARDLLHEANRIGRGSATAGMRAAIAAMVARADAIVGQMDASKEWLASAGLSLQDELTRTREFEHLAWAQLLVALGQGEAALPVLARLAAAAAMDGRTRVTLEVLVLKAMALRLQGEREQALTTLQEALALAEPEGYVRLFVEQGEAMVALLEDLADRSAHADYVATLRRAFSDGTTPPADPGTRKRGETLVERLSERELEVLRLVAAGASNQEIAAELVLAVGTVKKHINNIFGKLGVGSRMQAVARARAVGLLPPTLE